MIEGFVQQLPGQVKDFLVKFLAFLASAFTELCRTCLRKVLPIASGPSANSLA